MVLKALISFVSSDLQLNVGKGTIFELENEEEAQKLIADGLVEKVESLIPAGTINVTQNSTVDVSRYKTAKIQVNTWAVTFNGNNEAQEAFNIVVANGDSISQRDADDLRFTAPEGKKLAGWSESQDAEAPDIAFPYAPADNKTLYAVWVDDEE